jgi:hypothetical protein
MDLSTLTTQPFRLTDPRQARIHERLQRLVGLGPAAFFYDACRLMEESPFYQSTTHLVSHLLREVESALRDVLEPVSRWSEMTKKARGDPQQGHKQEIRRILAALDVPTDDPVAQMWLQLAGTSSEGALHRRAHRSSLASPRPVDNGFREFWRNTQSVLDAVSARLEVRFSAYRTLMDELAAKDQPSPQDINTLCEHIPNSLITRVYFFTRLKSPAWVQPLRVSGVFKEIPGLIRHEDGIGSPVWPAAEYLKRVVAAVPDEVGKVLLQAPETDNHGAIADLAELACVLPREVAAEWASRTAGWTAKQDFLSFGLPRGLGALISNLARRGGAAAGLELATALLWILEDPRGREKENDESPFRNLRQPTARFDLWEYEQILTKNVPDLLEVLPEQVLARLCDLLDRVIVLSDRRGAERRPDDHSYIWLPAIEEHQQNLVPGFNRLLVAAVRSTAERIAEKSPDSVPALVQGLEQRGESWMVFRRIALHLLRLFPDSAPSLVRERLLDRQLFDSLATRHEYFLLQKQCFGRLAGEDQLTILAWIEAGPPNREEQRKSWEEFIGRKVTEEEEEQDVKRWKRDRLTPLKDYLDPAWAAKYGALLDDAGPPEHPEFASYTEGGAFGPSSPTSRQELKNMSLKEVVDYLRGWQPSGDPIRGESKEGLARELSATASEKAHEYAEAAAEFKRLAEPTYIRALIDGFQNALKSKRAFPWEPVLDLCEWAVAQERDIPGRRVEFLEMDPHWGWTRSSVSRLLDAGFASDENAIPFGLREHAWRALAPVTGDPDPTPEQEERYVKGAIKDEYGSQGLNVQVPDPLTSAINSVRGAAMETVVRYTLWVRNGFEKSGNAAQVAQGFDATPEVKGVLEHHLDPIAEPSVAIRAVYGEYLPLLHSLDRKWADENTARILPRNELHLWHAAWDTYVCRCSPYDEVFDWLKEEYTFAIEQVGTHKNERANPQAPDVSLARHLMVFYARGKLDGQGALLDAFYRRADGKLRGQALNYVGWDLRSVKDPLPGEVAQRLRALLEARVEAAKHETAGAAEELRQYGWWFACGKFDDEWSLRQLLEVLRIAGWVEPDHLVVERLAGMSRTRPLLSVEALTLVVEGDKRGWGVVGWRDKAKDIIRAARRSGDAEARKRAEELANLLDSRGNFDFGEVLKEPIN